MKFCWRHLLLVIWTISMGSGLWFWAFMGVPWYGLLTIVLFGYLFTGFGMYILCCDHIKFGYAWRLVVGWAPGLLSERCRDWVTPNSCWRSVS